MFGKVDTFWTYHCGKAEGLEIDIVDEEEVGITLVIEEDVDAELLALAWRGTYRATTRSPGTRGGAWKFSS
jgi:hypothetical protein